MDRYEDMREWVRGDSEAPQGIAADGWDAEIRKSKLRRIDMSTYEVDAPAVAEAIIARLLAMQEQGRPEPEEKGR